MKRFIIFFALTTVFNTGFSQWNLQCPFPPNPVHDIEFFDQYRGWMISGSEVLITSDRGYSWQIHPTGVNDPLYSMDFSDDENGWIVGYEGLILNTNDGGLTWNEQTSGTGYQLGSVHFDDDQVGWIGGQNGSSGKILHTTNGGESWQTQYDVADRAIRKLFFLNSQLGWVVGKDGLAMNTEDGGITWNELVNFTHEILTSVYFVDESNGWIVSLQGSIFHTSDGGNNWELQAFYQNSLLSGVHFTDLLNGYISGDGKIYMTNDGGLTWIIHYLGPGSFFDIYFFDSDKGWAYGSSNGMNGKLYRTDDGGETWELKSNSQLYPLFDICFVSEEIGWTAGGAGEIMFTDDGGYTWTPQNSPTWMEWYSLCFIDEQKGWICGGWSNGTGQIIHTCDGGNTWVIQHNDQGTWFKSIFFVDENNGWAGRRNGQIYRTIDGGLNWNMINTGAEGIIKSIYFVNSLKGWAVSYSAEILISEDGGNTWTLQYDEYGHLNSVFFIDEEIGWAVGDNEILHTIDGGNNWEVQYNGSFWGQLNDVVFADLNNGYAVGDYVLLRTTDGGETWIEEEYYPLQYYALFAISSVGSRYWISGDWGLIVYKGPSETRIFIDPGFQFISSRIIPENPEMLIVVEEILNENLNFIRNSQGQTLRKIGPNWVNGIGDWIVDEGYLVKMYAEDSFTISGVFVDPACPIPVEAGFQFVSYFPETAMDALIAFETIIGDDLHFIRSSEGTMIRKIGPTWVNGIGDCQPGEGYLVKMFADSEIVYPASAKSSGKTTTLPVNFIFEAGNPAEAVYTLYLEGLEIGDEVAAFDGELMVGSMKISSEKEFNNELQVFSTTINGKGYKASKPMILKLWDSSSQSLIPFEYTMTDPYNEAYMKNTYPEEDGLYSIIKFTKGVNSIENIEENISIFPNPSEGIFNISIEGVSGKVQMKVFDIHGNDYRFFEIEGTRNLTTQQLDLKELAAGVYFINFSSKEFSQVKKIVIQ